MLPNRSFIRITEPARPAVPVLHGPVTPVRIPVSVRTISGLHALIQKRQGVLLEQIGTLNRDIAAKERKRAELQRKLNNIAGECSAEFLARARSRRDSAA
jgi:hypothetical protein